MVTEWPKSYVRVITNRKKQRFAANNKNGSAQQLPYARKGIALNAMTNQSPRFRTHEECQILTCLITRSASRWSTSATPRRVAAGERLIDPATPPDQVFRVLSGAVQMLRVSPEGNETDLGLAKPGDWFGQFCFCADREERHDLLAFATRSSEVWEVQYDTFRMLLQQEPGLIENSLELLCAKIVDSQRLGKRLAIADGRRRMAALLLDLTEGHEHDQSIELSHEELAGMAGLSRPFVSVVLGEFRETGLVQYRRKGPLQVHRKALEQFFTSDTLPSL